MYRPRRKAKTAVDEEDIGREIERENIYKCKLFDLCKICLCVYNYPKIFSVTCITTFKQ